MKNHMLWLGFLIIGVSVHSKQSVADIQIEIAPFGEDDYYDDDFDEGEFQIWIGPGFYYGLWFDSPYVYRDYCRRRYYYDRHRGRHHEGHHGEHRGHRREHRQHHGGGHHH